MIGPILFYWRQLGGIWEPVARRKGIDQTEEWFDQIHRDLAYSGCSFLLIQPWHSLWGLESLERHRRVWVDYPEILLAPHVDGPAWRAGDEPVAPPSSRRLEDEPWGRYWAQRLDLIPAERWLTFRKKRVVTMTGNFDGWETWPHDSLERIADQLERRYGDRFTIMAPKAMRRWFSGVEYECNMFSQRGHLSLSAPTAAVRPGFWHMKSVVGDRYVPRRGGYRFRLALRSALQVCDLIFVESLNERTENSNIERCYRRARRGLPVYWNAGEHWGWGKRRYWRIIRQEVRDAAS